MLRPLEQTKVKLIDWLRRLLEIDHIETALEAQVQAIENLQVNLSEQCAIGVDFSPDDQSAIVIVSKLKGGQTRIIHAHFSNLAEMEALVSLLQRQYGASKNITWDLPQGMRRR